MILSRRASAQRLAALSLGMSLRFFALLLTGFLPMTCASIALATDSASTTARGAAPPPERHPPAALLDRIAEAAGGRELVSEVKGLRLRGKVLSLVDGPSATLRIDLSLSGSLREETRDAESNVVRWLDGRLAWIGADPKHAKPAPPEVRADVRLRFHELAAPLELASAPAESLVAVGQSPEGWERIVRRFGENRLAYDVDVETGRIQRVSRLSKTGEVSASMELEDYRTADGVSYPFRWTTIVGGRAMSETNLERLGRLDEVSPGDFAPQSAGAGS